MKTKRIWLVVQTNETYVHTYETEELAESHREQMEEEAAIGSTLPRPIDGIEVNGDFYLSEQSLIDLLEDLDLVV